jgi:replicative DNA helicase
MTTTQHPTGNGRPAAAPEMGGSPPPKLTTFADVLGAFRADAQAAFDAHTKGVSRGPGTGLKALDDVLGGVMQPGVHIVQGGSGVGKTAYALQVAATCGYPALFVSCEMHLVELLRRHTARVTGTFLDRLKSGELAPDDAVRKAEQAIAAAPWLAVVDATQSYLKPELLKDFALATRDRHDAKHVLVVVDSVHSWAEASPLPLSEYDTLNAHLAELRRIAARLNCPVLGVAERNRATMAAGGLNSAAGSRKFEYGAESVIGLAVVVGKDAPLFPEKDKKPVRVSVEKNRNGNHGVSLKATFFGRYQAFAEGDW